jgi:hypothetical protein
MAKLYKVRKKCMICGNVFYPRYAGSLYCEECKSRKKEEIVLKPAKKTSKPAPKKTKTAKPAKTAKTKSRKN